MPESPRFEPSWTMALDPVFDAQFSLDNQAAIGAYSSTSNYITSDSYHASPFLYTGSNSSMHTYNTAAPNIGPSTNPNSSNLWHDNSGLTSLTSMSPYRGHRDSSL
jgi:hypothetical protein